MLFLADTAFALELIAIGVGFIVLLKAQKDETGTYKGLGKFLGYFILVLAFFALLCTSYYAVKYWEDGRYQTPAPMMMGAMMGSMHGGSMGMMNGGCGMKAGGMHGKDKDDCPMMDKKGMMNHGSGKMDKGKMMDHGDGMMGKNGGKMKGMMNNAPDDQ